MFGDEPSKGSAKACHRQNWRRGRLRGWSHTGNDEAAADALQQGREGPADMELFFFLVLGGGLLHVMT